MMQFFKHLNGSFTLFAEKDGSSTAETGKRDIKKLNFNELENIKSLELSFNQISGIDVLIELKNIRELNLYGNRIIDLTPLKELKNIRILSLGSNQIIDL